MTNNKWLINIKAPSLRLLRGLENKLLNLSYTLIIKL